MDQHYYHYYLDLCLSYKYKRELNQILFDTSPWKCSLNQNWFLCYLLDRDTITSCINNIQEFTKASNGDPVIKSVQICTFLIICITFVCFRCRWTWSFDPIFGTRFFYLKVWLCVHIFIFNLLFFLHKELFLCPNVCTMSVNNSSLINHFVSFCIVCFSVVSLEVC